MDTYKYKYYKYKSKYFDLLNQNGGFNLQDLKSTPNNLLEPTTKKFIESLKNQTPIYKLPVNDARDVLNKMQSDDTYKLNVDIENIELNYNGQNISISIFRPKNNNQTLNAIMYFHGGGWILG